MQPKFRWLIIILIFSFQLFSQEDNKKITFLKIDYDESQKNLNLILSFLIDISEIKIIDKYKNIIIFNTGGQFDKNDTKEIINYIYSHGIDGYYILSGKSNNNTIEVNLNLFNSTGTLLYTNTISIPEKLDSGFYLSDSNLEKWKNIIFQSVEVISSSRKKNFVLANQIKNQFKYEHDFPLFSFGLTAISGKIYFDERMVDKTQKIFSVSPLDIRLTFFPLRYFEIGLFCKLDFGNMVFKYLDKNNNDYKYYDSSFLLNYGFFSGFSYFNGNKHYSIGLQISNMYYHLNDNLGWAKTNDHLSYFLPQFCLYQRLDINIIKILYFSLIFNLKTISFFNLDNNYFYSKPFWYDFFVVEISFVGLTIMI